MKQAFMECSMVIQIYTVTYAMQRFQFLISENFWSYNIVIQSNEMKFKALKIIHTYILVHWLEPKSPDFWNSEINAIYQLSYILFSCQFCYFIFSFLLICWLNCVILCNYINCITVHSVLIDMIYLLHLMSIYKWLID